MPDVIVMILNLDMLHASSLTITPGDADYTSSPECFLRQEYIHLCHPCPQDSHSLFFFFFLLLILLFYRTKLNVNTADREIIGPISHRYLELSLACQAGENGANLC